MPRKRTKKRKFVRPATGLKSQVPSGYIGPQGVGYHKNFVFDKLQYTVLTIAHMSQIVKDTVHATLKTIVTADQAFRLPNGVNGWACEKLDLRGRVLVLSYKGVEVALFFKRQTTELRLIPGDRYPEGVMKESSETWQRLDIAGLSAKKANFVTVKMQERIEGDNEILQKQIQALQAMNDELENQVSKYLRRIEFLEKSRRGSNGSGRNGKDKSKGRTHASSKSVSRRSTKKNKRRVSA